MPITLRPFNPESDYPRLAALLCLHETERISPERLREMDVPHLWPGHMRERIVAVDETGYIVGYWQLDHEPYQPPGVFDVMVIVDVPYRKHGIGGLLYDSALAALQRHGATRLRGQMRDRCNECLCFAEKRGFTIDRHIFESTLDLVTFDEGRFTGVVERVQASGIRFFTLADTDQGEDALRKLYEVYRHTSRDIPGEALLPEFEQWRYMFRSPRHRADGYFIAAEGERWVGMTVVGYFKRRTRRTRCTRVCCARIAGAASRRR